MRLDFTPAAQRSLHRAMALADADNVQAVRPFDLLRALLAEDEGQPATLVEQAGVGSDRLRRLFPVSADTQTSSGDVALADETRDLLAQARELARLHGADGSVGSDHLLLAILEAAAPLREMLVQSGLDWPALRERIAPAGEALHLDEPLDFKPPSEVIDLARILDAAANRAREAMRVLEDYARFVLDDAFLTRTLKEMRHGLAEAISEFPAETLLHARDTLLDVGTGISTARETERASMPAVVLANAKRLQEALRAMEEFAKIHSPALGQTFERLRYQVYTLEKALVLGGDARSRIAEARLYVLVTEHLCRASLLGTVSEALAGGAQIIQLREKALPDRTLLEKARAVRKLTRKAGAIFIVNDRPDIAVLTAADGVHLGQDDMPLRDARRMLGPDALIGVSTHNLEQVHEAVLAGASYVGVGPTFPSRTKEFADFAGLDFVRQVAAETTLPAFALGGITLDLLPEVLAAGCKGIAVSQAICAAEDPRAMTAKFRALLAHRPPSASR